MKKCAIITGGASGIGRSIADALSEEGKNVVVADVNEEEGRLTAERIGGHFVKAELSQRESCRQLVDAAVQKYNAVDILINNAGLQHVSPLEEFAEEKWDQMLNVMLTAPFLLTKYVWPSMRTRKWGRIVNIASIHGLVASVNKVGYVSAKHGLMGLTRTAALEGGSHGITVNALCPSYVRTPMVESQITDQSKTHKMQEGDVIEKILLKSAAIKRLLEPREVADIVLYLCSDKGEAITGACWTIDCGWTAQ